MKVMLLHVPFSVHVGLDPYTASSRSSVNCDVPGKSTRMHRERDPAARVTIRMWLRRGRGRTSWDLNRVM